MNENDKQSKSGKDLSKLNQELMQLISFKVDLLTRGEVLMLEYSEDAAAQSRERRSGILNLPLLDVPFSFSIMRPSIAVPRASFFQTALG